jgi:hypothetical protein
MGSGLVGIWERGGVRGGLLKRCVWGSWIGSIGWRSGKRSGANRKPRNRFPGDCVVVWIVFAVVYRIVALHYFLGHGIMHLFFLGPHCPLLRGALLLRQYIKMPTTQNKRQHALRGTCSVIRALISEHWRRGGSM